MNPQNNKLLVFSDECTSLLRQNNRRAKKLFGSDHKIPIDFAFIQHFYEKSFLELNENEMWIKTIETHIKSKINSILFKSIGNSK